MGNAVQPLLALAALDFRFRLAVILPLTLAAGFGLAGTDYLVVDGVAWKTLVFAALSAGAAG